MIKFAVITIQLNLSREWIKQQLVHVTVNRKILALTAIVQNSSEFRVHTEEIILYKSTKSVQIHWLKLYYIDAVHEAKLLST